MGITINTTKFTKRRNSTAVPNDFDNTYDVVLKDACSYDRPSFVLNEPYFLDNYLEWSGSYYFVTDVIVLRNNLLQVNCQLDVLGTYRAEILGSTQYVAYSSVSGGTWLKDNRLPVLGDAVVAKQEVTPPFLNTTGDRYILSVLGKNGCAVFACSRSQINNLLDHVEGDNTQIVSDFMNDPAIDFSSVESGLESLTRIMTQTDLLGNAFANAPTCIRGCIWTPLARTNGGTGRIFLGNYDTQVDAWKLYDTTAASALQITIPWHFTDWRRTYCESIYLYLPFVGNINIPTNEIVGVSQLTIKYSYTIVDGSISYEVLAGDQVIGTYGGSCAQQIPLGINQVTSVGDIATQMIQGAKDTVSTAIMGTVPTLETGINAVAAAYNVADAAYSTNPTTIGGQGGGSGAGLDMVIRCVSVAHPTVIEPSAMAATMGVPNMQPLTLSSCSGYCQCVNAHVAADAHMDVLNEIDMFLNSGFFIE